MPQNASEWPCYFSSQGCDTWPIRFVPHARKTPGFIGTSAGARGGSISESAALSTVMWFRLPPSRFRRGLHFVSGRAPPQAAADSPYSPVPEHSQSSPIPASFRFVGAISPPSERHDGYL